VFIGTFVPLGFLDEERLMAQRQTFKRSFSRDIAQVQSQAQDGIDVLTADRVDLQPEAFLDALIRFSLLAWRTELEARSPRWSQVHDRLFSEIIKGR
jgi:hypothetical protein